MVPDTHQAINKEQLLFCKFKTELNIWIIISKPGFLTQYYMFKALIYKNKYWEM